MAISTAQAAAEELIQRQEQWNTDFVHCDVKKDHGPGYNADIVQAFLSDESTGIVNNKSKEDLFNSLVGRVNFIEDIATETNIPDSITLTLFDNPTYTCNVFRKGKEGFSDSAIVQQIQAATRGTLGLGTSFLKISDTTHNTDDIHRLWNNSDATGNPIIQARTRAVQMDAAYKMTSKKVGNDAMFYIEGAPPDNTRSVLYPSYYTNNKLSYLYCKYPVYIKHNGVKGDKYTLKVGLSYIKNNKSVDIDGDLNTAGFMFKIVSKLGHCFGMSNPDILEAGYIGKHSGDVLQVLDAFRDINLVHYNDTTRKHIHKVGDPSIFETIDINAASKAFSTGIYCIWLHMKDKLVVFTKVIDNLQYLRNKYTILYNTIPFKNRIISLNIETINKDISSIDKIIRDSNALFQTIITTSGPILYKDFLEKCAKYSISYEKLPLLNERRVYLLNKYQIIINLQKTLRELPEIQEDQPSESVYQDAIAILEEFDRLLNPFTNLDGELAAMRNLLDRSQSIEFNDLILNERNEITYASAFDCINLYLEEGRSKRILADRISSAYGLDIINMTYKKLSTGFDIESGGNIEAPASIASSTKHMEFIRLLYSKVPEDKQGMFISLIRTIGIPSPAPAGGSRKTLKKDRRQVGRTYKQKGGNQELVQEILETLSFFANIYREKNENNLRTYIINKLGESVSAPYLNFLPSDTSKVILNIMETYEDIADSLNSEMLKIMLTLVEDTELYEINQAKINQAKPVVIQLTKASKPTKIVYKGPKLIKGPSRLEKMETILKKRNTKRRNLFRFPQPEIMSPRKTRKKLRE